MGYAGPAMTALLTLRDYVLDRDDPRAPTMEQWDQMSPEERRRVVDTLPAELPLDLFAPEGDLHRKTKAGSLDGLERYFQRIGRKIYLSSELGVFYPGVARFAPDVLAVLDVEPGDRMSWVVAKEGKGLDFVLEVHVAEELPGPLAPLLDPPPPAPPPPAGPCAPEALPPAPPPPPPPPPAPPVPPALLALAGAPTVMALLEMHGLPVIPTIPSSISTTGAPMMMKLGPPVLRLTTSLSVPGSLP